MINMKKLYKELSKKINSVIFSLIATGIVLIMLAVVIVAYEFYFRLFVGILVIVVSFMFFYGAYKIYSIKKEVKKFFKF